MEQVTATLHNHYRETFLLHGATSKGVDWGEKEWASLLRQSKMLEVINNTGKSNVSLLDVGCGYGALADIIKKQELSIDYTGIEVVKEMLEVAKKNHPNHQFIHGDILEVEIGRYDYVVCNGILTQKLDTSILEMNQFAQRLIRKLFEICNCGVAFNLMTTFVNFQSDNLYYRNPAELMAWCMSELTPHIRVDCAYQLWYEYTVYLYKKPN
ncbi:MAG: class I SAM-dependent methyltransferase [Pseudanabaena sp.]|jgi:SAM-dependent methyltransferase|uniref:class I SAM-dependent methyltransferase n=1 Tax=Pseudanabaena mucicola TaxID=71190 RepID=UPI002577F4DE|nr:class I SAM-dependent methyltransferase [Pseudanabaena mucicola]